MPQEKFNRDALRKRRRREVRPNVAALDALESRVLLAAASIAIDGTLVVTGTSDADALTLRLAPTDPTLVQVQDGVTTLFAFRLDRVNAISIDLGDGDDTLNVDTVPGLVTGVAAEVPVRIVGGAGNDALLVSGAPATGVVTQTLSFGPDAGSGTLVSRTGGAAGAAPSQSLSFAGMESLADTSSAASLTVLGGDGSNIVELTAGPLAGGATHTGTLRFIDVTPCPVGTPVAPAADTSVTATDSTATPATAAIDARDPESRREAKRLAKQAKKEAQRLAKEAKRLAREQKRAAAAAKRKGIEPVARPAPAVPAAPSPETFVIDRAHLAVHFANKSALVLDTAGGDDRFDLNFPGPTPAGLQTLTIVGGAGHDLIAERATAPGITVLRTETEGTSPTRDFALTTECPAPHLPPIENPPPPPAGLSAATSSRDRDAGSSTSASSSRDADAKASQDKDESASEDRDASSSGSSSDRDANASNDRNASSASNGD